MSTQEHLDWLLSLLESEYANGWKAWVWNRAKEIAQDPEHADLPRLLEEAMSQRSLKNEEAATESSSITPKSPKR